VVEVVEVLVGVVGLVDLGLGLVWLSFRGRLTPLQLVAEEQEGPQVVIKGLLAVILFLVP
jgi:hypothetical protein